MAVYMGMASACILPSHLGYRLYCGFALYVSHHAESIADI
jgi:hypothetical protein